MTRFNSRIRKNTEIYYPIYAIKKNELRWDAICPIKEFKHISVSASDSLDAAVQMIDVMISVCNSYLSRNKSLPEGMSEPAYLKVSDPDTESLFWMSLSLDYTGYCRYSSHAYGGKTRDTYFVVFPQESLWTQNAISEYMATNCSVEEYSELCLYNRTPFPEIRLNGFFLPEYVPLDFTHLEKTMGEILVKSNCEMYKSQELTEDAKIREILESCSDAALELLETEISQYSECNIYKVLYPQLELSTYLSSHYAQERSTRPYVSSDDAQLIDFDYTERHSSLLEEVTIAQKRLLDVVSANSPHGKYKLDRNKYLRLLALAYHFNSFKTLAVRISYPSQIDSIQLSQYKILAYNHQESQREFRLRKEIEAKEIDFGEYKKYCPPLSENFKILMGEERECAYHDEFGLSYSEIEIFEKGLLRISGRMKNRVYYKIPESQFRKFMIDTYGWTNEMCSTGLELFCLIARGCWSSFPEDGSDWDYINPENQVSYYSPNRRPLVKTNDTNGNSVIYYGERFFNNILRYMNQRIDDGKYPCKSRKMKGWISKVQNEKGEAFPQTAANIIEKKLGLKTFLKLKPQGMFNLNEDVGDVDIGACDYESNIFYSIECKNLTHAHDAKQLRTEYERFGLISTDENKMEYVVKHRKRDAALISHINELKKRCKFSDIPTVVSLFLTSHILECQTCVNKPPIPIISLHELLTEEKTALEKCRDEC